MGFDALRSYEIEATFPMMWTDLKIFWLEERGQKTVGAEWNEGKSEKRLNKGSNSG